MTKIKFTTVGAANNTENHLFCESFSLWHWALISCLSAVLLLVIVLQTVINRLFFCRPVVNVLVWLCYIFLKCKLFFCLLISSSVRTVLTCRKLRGKFVWCSLENYTKHRSSIWSHWRSCRQINLFFFFVTKVCLNLKNDWMITGLYFCKTNDPLTDK